MVADKKNKSKYVWWKHGVIYHLLVRSFYDSNNDGVGDLQGVIQKLDYLSLLGIDAIWLSPFYKSPRRDFGYDVSNYLKVDSDYGALKDFKNLIAQAHKRGIRIIIDMILNHTSDQHDWFAESRSSKDNPKREWYLWKESSNRKIPNNWRTPFGKSAWEYDKHTDAYYFHSFLKEQPDLNWRNPEVGEALFSDIEYWLKLGVDGLRLDVINLIVKDKKFRNNPPLFHQVVKAQKVYSRNRPKSIEIIKSLRKLLDRYNDRMCVGEIYTLPPGNSKLVANYLDNGKKALNMAFDFSLIFAKWRAKSYRAVLENGYKYLPQKGWACTVFSNHDLNRNNSKPLFLSNHTKICKLKALMALTLYGTPFIYYGEEIGMKNTRIPYKRINDRLGKMYWPFYTGRDKSRTPMQWNSSVNGGFSNAAPWLPVNKNYCEVNVVKQLAQKDSILNVYRELIILRRSHKVLSKGKWRSVETRSKYILGYQRFRKNKKFIILINFSPFTQKTNDYSNYYVVFSTGREEQWLISNLKLRGYEGVILSETAL